MTKSIAGLHHVTAISGPPQANVDFFTKVLGQRLVKKTVNFDDPGTYHLYYGDQDGSPGTIMTFFPFVNAGPGRSGSGMASAYAYSVPGGQFDTWMARLTKDAIDFDGPVERFGARVITLHDPDGAPVELVETNRVSDTGLDGFHSVTLWEQDLAPTQRLLTDVFGYEEIGHETSIGTERLRLKAPGDARGGVIDLVRAESDAVQLDWREKLATAGFNVTPVIDRQYFNAIYFREPGGVLFEIATDPPGFTADEDLAHLGEKLMLPAQHEHMRTEIEQVLPPIAVSA